MTYNIRVLFLYKTLKALNKTRQYPTLSFTLANSNIFCKKSYSIYSVTSLKNLFFKKNSVCLTDPVLPFYVQYYVYQNPQFVMMGR